MGKRFKQNMADACEEYSKIFGANKNLYRVVISTIDGLKPVQRRILYSMWDSAARTEFRKIVRIGSDALRFHPHGDGSAQDAAVKMAQPWDNNICTIEGLGNFGSLKGDEAGAGRYINARLSKYAIKCFFEDFQDSNVDMKEAYSGHDVEPEVLPARYPHALMNGSLGIGYGLASNIPPFNLKEVLKATIRFIKDPNADVYLIPDSPTGAAIVDEGQFPEICKTGVGKYTMKGTVKVDRINNIVTITSVPMQITLASVISKIIDLRMEKKMLEVNDIKDDTNGRNGMRCNILLRSDADPDKFVEKLYSMGTGMKNTYPVNFKMIDDYQDYDYTLQTFMLTWLDYRREMKRSQCNTKLVRLMEENHMNEVLILVLQGDNAEKTTKIMKTSENKNEAIQKLIKEYGITSLQATVVANMRQHELTKESYREYLLKREEYRNGIAALEHILDDSGNDEIDKLIIEELEEGIKLFGAPRRSEVIDEAGEKEVPNTDHVVAISMDGICKKLSMEAGTVGKVGNNNQQFIAIKVNNRDNLLVFDKSGNVSKVSVAQLPEMSVDETGISLKRYFTVQSDIIMVLPEPNKQTNTDGLYILFVSKFGMVKKTDLSNFMKIKDKKVGITLDDGDELSSAIFVSGNTTKDIILYTNNGNGVRLNINDFKVYGPSAKGLRQINLSQDEFVIGCDKIEPSKPFIFYLTSQGKVKITETRYLPQMKRKDETVSLISLDDGESLIGIKSVTKTESVVIYKKHSEPETIELSDIEVSARISKAKKVVKMPKGEVVANYQVIVR